MAEIFSPPRVCCRARTRGLRGGWSFDDNSLCPVTGKTWDLLNPQEQKRAWNLSYKTKPKLLVSSPPLLVLAKVEMAVNMCISQHKAGRKFVFEHPAVASSWNLPCLKRLADFSGIYSFDSDLLRIYTNRERTDELIDKRCLVDCELDLCDAFIDSMLMEEIPGKREVRSDLMTVADMCDPVEEKQIMESMVGIDDVSSELPGQSLIRKAQQEEMRGFEERKVFHHVLRSVAEADPEGKFIEVRWVDVNNGTKEVLKVRSRLVGQEFAHGERRDDLYAPTPPQAAARFLLSTCASRGKRGPGDYRILLLDIKKAFLYGKMSRNVYIELPAEDPMSEGGST